MSTRRHFLHTALVGTITAPLVARALVGDKPTDIRDFKVNGLPGPLGRLIKTRAILVPSNRVVIRYIGEQPPGVWYRGDWDGTFKLEWGCTNPAYVLLDLVTHDAPAEDRHVLIDLKAIYHWGQYCDELVVDCVDKRYTPMGNGGYFYPGVELVYTQRFMVNTTIRTEAERDKLHEDLSMHFLNWKASDSRYCKSWHVWV